MADWKGSHHHWVLARSLEAGGRDPHSSKIGICFTKSPLLWQRYTKAPPYWMLPGLGSPAKVKSAVFSTSGARSSSWSLILSSRPRKAHIRREWR